MASVAYGIHKASPAPPLQDLEILGPETGNMPCMDLPEYGAPLHKQATSDGLTEMVGTSRALRSVIDQVETVAATDSSVLIEGETGTGKELIARAIHTQSERRVAPFVKLNCAAIPAELVESELFGHEKGAFTGAINQRLGRFEAAHRGTLFLDEIGDMPLNLQAKLLRVLQESEFERLGSTHTRSVDVRIVAATNQNLVGMVAEKQFRMDLYYRLNVFPIAIPPLRHRPGDIPLLVAHFVQRFAKRMSKDIYKISQDAMGALMRYPWPGNIRELQNYIERAVILTKGDVLQTPALPSPVNEQREPITLEQSERSHILKVLKESNWVVGGAFGAAARLGLKRTTLIDRMRKHGLSRDMPQGPLPDSRSDTFDSCLTLMRNENHVGPRSGNARIKFPG
jgi:formate hydrogenlyase transcriptional activator